MCSVGQKERQCSQDYYSPDSSVSFLSIYLELYPPGSRLTLAKPRVQGRSSERKSPDRCHHRRTHAIEIHLGLLWIMRIIKEYRWLFVSEYPANLHSECNCEEIRGRTRPSRQGERRPTLPRLHTSDLSHLTTPAFTMFIQHAEPFRE